MIEKEDSVYFFTANIENEQTGNFVLSMYEEGIVVHEELHLLSEGELVFLCIYTLPMRKT